MSILLGRRHRLLHVRALLAQRNGGEQENCPVHHGSPLDSELLFEEKGDPTGTVMGRSQGITSTSSRTRSRRNARRRISRVSTTGSSATRNSARICLTSVAPDATKCLSEQFLSRALQARVRRLACVSSLDMSEEPSWSVTCEKWKSANSRN